jgi:23S rRNA (uracil1939-C5)-methyltransferase
LSPEQIADADKIEQRSVGYHLPRFFDKVVDIEECRLMSEPVNEIRNSLKQFAIENNISFYHQREHTGLLRNIVIRNSNTGGLMVILIVSADDRKQISLVMDFLHQKFPQITSLMYMVNSKLNDSYTDLPATLYAGDDHIVGEMAGLKFKIGPNSFYQTNTDQATVLYGVAKDFAELTGNEVVYDLYTGTGTIACFVADKAQKVIGIEYVEDAIADAKVNAQMNNLTNLDFYAGDMKNVLTDSFIAEHGRPDVIITDPPRSGMHPDVVQVILNANPKRIVYVSCNPATQARDLAMMSQQYRIAKVQPVDMFPQTQHVENVVQLIRIE